MDYMDQTMPCKKCGKEHSQLGTGVCFPCEKQEKEEKAKAEWDAKSPVEQARSHLESWSNPTCYTFSRVRAKFVLEVFNEIEGLRAQKDKAEARVKELNNFIDSHPDTKLLDFLESQGTVNFDSEQATVRFDVPSTFEGSNNLREVIRTAMQEQE